MMKLGKFFMGAAPGTQHISEATSRKANRLSREKSPYLLQHQFNPVDWYAWGPAAFEQAQHGDKPIFLSIGYSTCHWCHVMERESFENHAVAEFLNRHFISIKVDREERPDVDKIYMTFVQASTGQGGWPMSVFLTPDLKPFYGGTYFPPTSHYGRPGFLELLQQIAQLWKERRKDLANSASEIYSRLQQAAAASAADSPALLTSEDLRRAGQALKTGYDPRHGGFGNAPKFPQPSHPQFLLRYASRFHDPEALEMVLHTCERMAAGGIHDQLGGGFARYSVDAQWLVPHFEKMLYDNAQLAQLYLDCFLISERPLFAEVARDILDYVLGDMTDLQGGFYSAEDADSEGHEGKFYCWTLKELRELLEADELAVAIRHFGITEQGNFIDHSHPAPLPEQNVLSIADPNLSANERVLLEAAKAKMRFARAQRVRPGRDDKVLASWNGLMLGALARAAVVLEDERYQAAAVENLEFLKRVLWDSKGRRLYHRWREGERDQVELLEGYAFLLSGVIELYETTLEPARLEFAIGLAESLLERFYDSDNGGFWQSPAGTNDLILRLKEAYDGAEPSGNSVAILSLLKLGKITGRNQFTQAAEKSLRHFSGRLQQLPQALPYMLQALDFWIEEPARAVVPGKPNRPLAQELLTAVHSAYQPNKVVLGNSGPVEEFARTLPESDGAAVYVCTGTSCQPPASDPAQVRRLLASRESQDHVPHSPTVRPKRNQM
jgi:uncharacterized protein YyaL (SSP411 family)